MFLIHQVKSKFGLGGFYDEFYGKQVLVITELLKATNDISLKPLTNEMLNTETLSPLENADHSQKPYVSTY
uniref:Uncharacterized protein n=1 Tax=Megaselia scalaris TaxID=36166 RepID=T1GB44_MEGSC